MDIPWATWIAPSSRRCPASPRTSQRCEPTWPGLVERLLGRRSKKEDEDGSLAKQARDHFALPVIRALENIQDPKAAEKLGEFLDHPDYLVRCHTIQNIQNCGLTGFIEKLKEMSKKDEHKLVRESADIAQGHLQPLPPELNN